jgi:hypothetical protein
MAVLPLDEFSGFCSLPDPFAYPNERAAFEGHHQYIVGDFHLIRVTPFSRYQNQTMAETWCLIGALPEAKLSIQARFSEPYGTESTK